MSKRLMVMTTPEIEVDGVLDEKCSHECPKRGAYGHCELFGASRELGASDGHYYRLGECHEAERKHDQSEEGV